MIKQILATATIASTLLGGMTLLALPAFAQTTAVGTAATTIGGAVTGTNSGTSNTDGTGSGSGSIGVTAQTNATTGASVNGSATESGSATAGTAGQSGTSATADTSGDANTMLTISSTDAAVQEYDPNTSMSVTNPAMVQSSAQLSAYASGIMHTDPNIQNVQLSNSTVAMSYKESGKLFGFIPVSVSAKGQVNADGSVTITHPWYDFLVSTNDSAVQNSAEAQVKATIQSNTSNSFSSQMQAELMTDLYSAFSGTSATNVNSQTGATTTTTANASSTENMQGNVQDSMQSSSTNP